jgi:hypothetical protein
MKKHEIPDNFDETEIEAPNQEALVEFLSNLRELATQIERGHKTRFGEYRSPLGRREVSVRVPNPKLEDEKSNENLRGVLDLYSEDLKEPSDSAEHGDEEYFNQYYLLEGEGEEMRVFKIHRAWSEKAEKKAEYEMQELEEQDPAVARQEADRRLTEFWEKLKAEEAAISKGAGFVSGKELEGLNIYLAQFIKELKAEKAGK